MGRPELGRSYIWVYVAFLAEVIGMTPRKIDLSTIVDSDRPLLDVYRLIAVEVGWPTSPGTGDDWTAQDETNVRVLACYVVRQLSELNRTCLVFDGLDAVPPTIVVGFVGESASAGVGTEEGLLDNTVKVR